MPITETPSRIAAALATLGLATTLSACSPHLAPILAPQSPAGLDAAGQAPSAREVGDAVRAGLIKKRWVITATTDQHVDAQVSAGGHTATVRVAYNAGGWSISHIQSSPGLKYGQHRRHGAIIHRRYNNWIRQLDHAIRAQLQAPGQSERPVDAAGSEAVPSETPPAVEPSEAQ